MITINLLAPGRRRRVGPTPGTFLAVLGTALVIVALVAWTLYLGVRADTLKREVADLNKQIEALRPAVAEVDALERTITRLQQRQALLQALLASQLPASDTLEALRVVMPREVWLVSATTSTTRGVLFDGYTFSYKSVARFMVALSDSARFRNIDLTSTQKEKLGEREVVKFQVIGELLTEHPKVGDAPALPVSTTSGPPPVHPASAGIGGRP
jgi:Tfp pilus assembly protein PilN